MTPTISVLVPTRQRTHLLDHMLTSLVITAADPGSVEVVFRIDEDDIESRTYLTSPDLIGWLTMIGHVYIVVGPRLNGYATLPILINEAARAATANLLIVINDDVEFKSSGWDRRLCEEARTYPDGIFNLGVNTVLNNPNFVFPCQSRRQIEALGWFYDPRLVYPDIWLRDVLMPFGRAVRVEDVIIEHQWAGQTEDQERAVQQIVSRPDYWPLYAQCVHEGRQKIAAVLQAVAS